MTTDSTPPQMTADEIIKAKEELLNSLLERKNSLKDRFFNRRQELKEKYREILKDLDLEEEQEALEIKSELEKLGIKTRRGRPTGSVSKTSKRKKRLKLEDEEIKERLKAFMKPAQEYKCEDLFNHLNVPRTLFVDFFGRCNGFLKRSGSTKSTRYSLAS
jgi:hypothetical protein